MVYKLKRISELIILTLQTPNPNFLLKCKVTQVQMLSESNDVQGGIAMRAKGDNLGECNVIISFLRDNTYTVMITNINNNKLITGFTNVRLKDLKDAVDIVNKRKVKKLSLALSN